MFQDYKVAYLRQHVKIKEAVPLSFLRQGVSYILSESARHTPHAAAITHFDVTNLVEYATNSRRAIEECSGDEGESGAEGGEAAASGGNLLQRAIRKNFNAFLMKAIGHALYQMPAVNSFIDYSIYRNGGTLYQAEDVNIGFTVHTKYGVIKPVLRNPHQKTIDIVAQEMRTLTRKARRTEPETLYREAAWSYLGTAVRQLDFRALPVLWIWVRSTLFPRGTRAASPPPVAPSERLSVEEILGATCTVANIGMVFPGHQTVTVLTPPEVSMFGIGDLHQAPMVVNGEVVPRYRITIAGTIDHRAFDGGEIFPFAQIMQRYFDNPALIYGWKPGSPL